jgi:aspartate dehydrogenase
MLTVGIIGYGTLGRTLAEFIESKQAGNVELKAVLVRNLPDGLNSSSLDYTITNEEKKFFNLGLDLIIESAGHNAVHLYGEKALSSGSSFIVLSVGALGDEEFYKRLLQTAQINNTQIIIPSAAIAGLDRISAGVLGEIEEISLITKKHPRSWYGTVAEEMVDLATLAEPRCLFEGNARDAAKMFPQNVNVSAALSLAGIGFENTMVKVYADPTIQTNIHTIIASGEFGKVEIDVQNNPYKSNPKSSPIVAMSVIKVLRNLSGPLAIGL